MKAFILAAGYGKRLKPLTLKIPKPLVSVWAKPLIEHVIIKIKRYKIKEVGINLFHLGKKIEDFINSKDFGINFKFFYEEKLLDSGGAIKNAKDFLKDGDFLLHNSDILSEFDLNPIINFHSKNKNDVTIAIMKRETSRLLCFSNDMLLSGWVNEEKNISCGTINNNTFAYTGIQVISPRIFDFMPDNDVFGIFDFYLSNIEKLKISGFLVTPHYWFDVGSIEKLNHIRVNIF